MTSGNINSFVGDLVEMAKAMETLPQVQQELEESRKLHSETLDSVARIQSDLEQSRNYAASLEQKVRDLEVARDDAEMRFLEADDKLIHTLDRLNQMGNIISTVKATLDPPKPEPVKEPEPQAQPVATPASGESEAPFASVDTKPEIADTATEKVATSSDWQQDKAETSILPPGQSESSPTSATMDNTSATQDAPNAPEDQAASSAEPTHGPYFGKYYVEVPGWISREDWLADGGTKEGYEYGRGF